MRLIRDFHHYRTHEIADDDRVSRLEKRVIDLLLTSSLSETERDSSVAFELKHSSGITQFARLLAHKRGLDEEICSAGAVLHDIYVIVRGKYKDHARLAEPIARDLLCETGFRDAVQNERIIQLIVNHSDKHVFSDDPYIEFGKDADVLDCFLYPNAVEYYLRHKPIAHMFHYLGRAKDIWRDLGISTLPNFLTLLDSYQQSWLSETAQCIPSKLAHALVSEEYRSLPNFLLRFDGPIAEISFSRREATDTEHLHRKSTFRDLLRATTENPEILYDYFRRQGISPTDCCGIMVWSPIGVLEPIPSTPKGLARLTELTGAGVELSAKTGKLI